MATLAALPIELVENIVTNLDLRDVSSLRLTCREIGNKASQLSFAALFVNQDVKLTTRALKDFVVITSQGQLGYLLQNLTLTGIASNEPTTPEETAEHVRLLAAAFRNLKQRSPRRGLVSLTLGLAARVGHRGQLAPPDDQRVKPAWRTVWDEAARTFRAVVAALGESQMSVGERLDVFGVVACCSLACDFFVASAGIFSSGPVFGSLRKLTLSLSPPYCALGLIGLPARVYKRALRRHCQQVFPAVMQLGHVTRELEFWDLHWFSLGIHTSTSNVSDSPEEDSIVNSSSTVHVKNCSLRGVFTSEVDLLQFLQTARPEVLTLKDNHLITGKYTPIFDFISGQNSPIRSYHLEDLYNDPSGARRPIVQFIVPESSEFLLSGGDKGPTMLTRRASDAKEPIGFMLAKQFRFNRGQSYLNQQIRIHRHEFGPHKGGGRADIEMHD